MSISRRGQTYFYTDCTSMSRPAFIISFEIKPTGLLFFSQLNIYIHNPKIMLKPMCFRQRQGCPPVLLEAVNPRGIMGWGGLGSQG